MTKQKILKIIAIIASALFALVLVGIIIGGIFFFVYASGAPKLSASKLNSTSSTQIYDKDNKLIADLGAEKRTNVSTKDIPVTLVNAITSIEDKRFFKHRGIDLTRIAGSALHNLTSSTTQGGSTLEQQLIKLSYFSTSTKDQTLKRKAQEAWLAIQLDRKYTKAQILRYYVNKVYMSNGNYGMLTAAESYYGKNLKQLTIAQAALLAGMPQAPTEYDPYTNPTAAKERRDTVLAQMYRYKKISKKEYQKAVKTPITDGLQPLTTTSSYPKYMDNYLKEVISEVQSKTGKSLFNVGMKVYTNIDTSAQKHLYDIYNTDDYVTYPDSSMQVASTVIDVTTGKVIAQLGSRNQDTNVSFGTNQAVQTDRDWGSTMKPVTDFGPALENEIYTSTGARIDDSKYYYPGTSTQVYDWDKQYMGWMSIESALRLSRNVPAVKTLYAVGLSNSLSFLNKLGIYYPTLTYANAISSNTSSSANKYGASSEKMAAAYAAFSNGGIYYQPQYVNKVTFKSDGTSKTYKPSGTRAMKATTAYMMTSMLKTVLTYGTGTNAAISGIYQAGKTGTSNYSDSELEEIIAKNPSVAYADSVAPDENFVGYTTKYAMAVWTGYSNRMTPVYGTGMNVASSVYRTMMTYLAQNNQSGYTDWEMPSGLYKSGSYLYLSGTTSSNVYTYSSSSSTNSSSTTSSSSSDDEEDTTNSSDDNSGQSTSTTSSSTSASSQGTQPSQSQGGN